MSSPREALAGDMTSFFVNAIMVLTGGGLAYRGGMDPWLVAACCVWVWCLIPYRSLANVRESYLPTTENEENGRKARR